MAFKSIRSECERKPAISFLVAASAVGLFLFITCISNYGGSARISRADISSLLKWRKRPIGSMSSGATPDSDHHMEEIIQIEILNGTVFKPGSLDVNYAITNGSGPPTNGRTRPDGLKNGTKHVVNNVTKGPTRSHENIPISVPMQQSIGIHKQGVNVCDIYSGDWVLDDAHPLYEAGKCPYVSGDFDCKGNGRPDSKYEKWRWQPRNCNIPRFNARKMLEKLREKRLMFVGDSLNRNQWESMVCLLRGAVLDDRKSDSSQGSLTIFRAQDYNFSVEFFWAPFLVEMDESNEFLHLDTIENHGSYWKDVDILVFNTGHWWTHGNKVKARGFYQEGEQLYSELDPMIAFHKALKTWASWIDSNVDPQRTQVYFRGFSPMHFSPQRWMNNEGHKCYNETEPIQNDSFINSYPFRMQVVEDVLRQMRFPVSLLNITRMSDFRKDAHPSVYCLRKKKKLTKEQRNDPDQFADCSHWCLPGLPDTWNELLYALLVSKA